MKISIATSGKPAGGLCMVVKPIFLRLLLIVALCFAAMSANAAFVQWTGDGSGPIKYWSDPNNWSSIPQDGDDLVFVDNVLFFNPPPMFNDLTNLTVGSMRFWADGLFITPDWELYGNTLGISRYIILEKTDGENVFINCDLRLETNLANRVTFIISYDAYASELHLNGAMDLNGHDLEIEAGNTGNPISDSPLVELAGIISGTGNIALGGYPHGTLRFSGTEGNTFQGTVAFFGANYPPGPTLVLNKQAGVAVPGNLVMTNWDYCTVKLERSEQIDDSATVNISGGKFLLNSHAESIRNLELITRSTNTQPAVLDAGSGGLLGLYGNITAVCNNSSQTPAIKGRITLTPGEHTINTSGSAYAGLDMQAQILGDGNFSKTGESALLLTASNSCSSSISVLQGILDVRHSHALGDTAGPTQLYGGALLLRNVAIADETLFGLGQGTGGAFPGSVLTSIGASSWSGPAVLYTNLVVSGDMTFSGVISGTGGLGCFGSTVYLTGNNTYTGTNYISGSTLQVDGVQPQSPVDLHDQGRLQGSGTVGNINVKGSSTAIAPGSSPGILTCGSLDASGGNGQLEIELNGTIPGSGYDQINANGTVNLTGLSLNASRSFSPAQGDSFTIINNDGADSVTGTFTGLRQDTQVRIGNESFRVNYAGGTGNDVVLTRVGRDITWTNNNGGDWNIASNWEPNLVPGTNDTVFINKTVTVTLNTPTNCYSLNLGTSGQPTLTGTGDLTLYVLNFNAGTLSGSQVATVRHQMDWTGGTMSGNGRTFIPLAGKLTVTAGGTVTLSGGRILENGGTTLWNAGNIQAATATVITNRAGALFQVQSAAGMTPGAGGGRFDNAGTLRKTAAGTTTINGLVSFNNYGTVELLSGTLSLAGGGLNDGTMDMAAGTTLGLAAGTFNSSGGSSITGAGQFMVSGATANLAGLVAVTGTNRFDGGTANLTGNFICTNNTLVVSGGTANFSGTGMVTPAVVSMDSGTLSGSQNVTVLQQMNWSGGTMSGPGRTVIPPSVTLTIKAGTVTLSGGRILENGGTTLWNAGNIQAATATVITNRAGALFQVQSAAGITPGAGGGRFDNAGTFLKTSAGTTTINNLVSFNNYGAVELQSGTLSLMGGGLNQGSMDVAAGTTLGLTGGTFTSSAESSITGAGNFLVSNGATPTLAGLVNVSGTNTFSGSTANLTGNYICTNNTLVVSGGTVNLNGTGLVSPVFLTLGGGGTMNGSQDVTVGGVMNWTGGTLAGSGRTIILPSAMLNESGGPALSAHTLENGGTAIWTGSLNIGSAVITNRAGALFELRSATILNSSSLPGSRFDNAGTFRKSVNTGTATILTGMAFNNYNTVEIQTGILVANGGYTSTSNSLLYCALGGTTAGTGYGRLQVAGTVTLNGALAVNLANGFLPATNDTFTVLTAGTRNGMFANFYFPSNVIQMQLSNTTSSVVVRVTSSPAAVTLSNLSRVYSGQPLPVSVSTVPTGLAVTVTYNGASVVPADAGTYAVLATVNNSNYLGSASGTLVVTPHLPPRTLGVDVSHFQNSNGIPQASWNQMYSNGQRFAFIKATEGLTGPDDATMSNNAARAIAAGLLAGVYHFAHPENRPTTNGAVQEADHFLAYAGSRIGPGHLRPVLDWESDVPSMTVAESTDWVIAFSQEIVSQRGPYAAPIIYTSGFLASSRLDSRIGDYDLWIAAGASNPDTSQPATGSFNNWSFQQYSIGASGAITPLDLDVCHDEFKPLNSFLIPNGSPVTMVISEIIPLPNGSFQLTMTNTPGVPFTVLAATNLAPSLIHWKVIGAMTESTLGHFQFIDNHAFTNSQRFYRLRSP